MFKIILILLTFLSTFSFSCFADTIPQESTLNYDDIVQTIIKIEESGAHDSDPELKKKAQAVKESYEKEQKLKKQVEAQREKVEILNELKAIYDRMPERDYYHEVLERSSMELKMPKLAVVKLINNGDPRIGKIWKKMQAEQYQRLYNEVKTRRDKQKNSKKTSSH